MAALESGAQICDYMFQDEKMEEIVDRIQELVDLTVPADAIETACEHPAGEFKHYGDVDKFSITLLHLY